MTRAKSGWTGRFVLVCLAVVTVGSFKGCCGSAESQPPAIPLSVAAPANTPQPGRVDLVFDGALQKEVQGEGGECQEWDSVWYRAYASSVAAEGPAAETEWHLAVGSFVPAQPPTAILRLGESSFKSEPLEDPALLHKHEDGLELNTVLKEQPTGLKQVTVKGKITCQRYDTGTTVPDELLAYLARTVGADVRSNCYHDFGRAADGQCASAIVDANQSYELLKQVRSQLPSGWIAYVGTSRWLGEEDHLGVELAVGPGADQFDILRLARSDAINYGMSTEALIQELKRYDRQLGIDILEASTDTVVFNLRQLPTDSLAFAQDVYRFCPDSVDQGMGSVEALAATIVESKQVYLWWD